MNNFQDWIGKRQSASDCVTKGLLERFGVTFGLPIDATSVPLGFHWCMFPPLINTNDLAVDGHPPKGDFLPPISLPRRMWAASEITFSSPIPVDAEIERTSEIVSIEKKSGKSGDLYFLAMEHSIVAEQRLCVKEIQRIVFRSSLSTVAPVPYQSHVSLEDWNWQETVRPGTAMLFRYSALTFNSHRIHYDRPYTTDEECYPSLVVHGPLTATLLMLLCKRYIGKGSLLSFRFRAVAPAFVDQTLYLVGRPNAGTAKLRALGADGRTVMEAAAEFESTSS